MRKILHFPVPVLVHHSRWFKASLGQYDLAWPVDEFLIVAVHDRWALIGRWYDGEPVVYDGEDLEFNEWDEALLFALVAGVPVRTFKETIVEPLPDTVEKASWRRQIRLDHLSERLRAIDALIEKRPNADNVQAQVWKEALVQRWHRIAHRRVPTDR